MNGLSQAYLGDAVYELYVRTHLIQKGITKINKLHKEAVVFTSAKSQSKIMDMLLPELTEDETAEFKRGRNSTAKQAKKTASVKEYKFATGLESLFGYLYLNDQKRLEELFQRVVVIIEEGLWQQEL